MADTLDVVTLAEAKDAVKIAVTDPVQDQILARYVTAVSRRLDKAIGPVVQRTVTNEKHDGGRVFVFLDEWPATSITTVTEYDTVGTALVLTAETETTKPVDAYLTEPYSWAPPLFGKTVWRRKNGTPWWFEGGQSNVVVSYVAGRVANTAAVDARHKLAAGIMLQNLWRSEEHSVAEIAEFDVPAQNFPRFAVPRAVRELLADEWQGGNRGRLRVG